jgi:hypothetical protein
MSDSTVEQVLADAAAELGDFAQVVYTIPILTPFFRSAHSELWGCALSHGVQMVEKEQLYPLPANTTSLTPAAAGIPNMGEPYRLWERNASSTDKFSEMVRVPVLPQYDQTDRLRWWRWEGDVFRFIGATGPQQLKIEYRASSAPPTTGPIGIDGSYDFLKVRTAALAAATFGMQDRKQELTVRALGNRMEPDGSGGLLRQFLNPEVKAILPVLPPRWRTRRPHY